MYNPYQNNQSKFGGYRTHQTHVERVANYLMNVQEDGGQSISQIDFQSPNPAHGLMNNMNNMNMNGAPQMAGASGMDSTPASRAKRVLKSSELRNRRKGTDSESESSASRDISSRKRSIQLSRGTTGSRQSQAQAQTSVQPQQPKNNLQSQFNQSYQAQGQNNSNNPYMMNAMNGMGQKRGPSYSVHLAIDNGSYAADGL